MTAPCRDCGHFEHLHSGPCRATTISGPPSSEGGPAGDGYEHIGRDVTDCRCAGFAGRNGHG